MPTTKRITKLEVIDAGSNPDVDSDFHTEVREEVISYITDLYGKDNVANIVTFNSLAAKSAFKEMCTIYQIPFASATKIAALVPPPIEGVDCTLDDIFNPQSDRYGEGAEFRAATSGLDWQKIIQGAINIEGRYKSTGVHPCGIIMSSRPLSSVIPLQVRQTDGRVITQWTYPECEEIGLIKFDFLGLDTVDLIQHTVEYIIKANKTPPNMLDIIHGPMDDKATYEMLAKGDTIGIFQLGSQLVQDFLKVMKPTEFEDIAAATALMRPGPMGMLSHVRYANRKNGKEEISALHPDFRNSPLDEILGKTQGVVVYQEQILKIANEIAGLTLQEGDELRSAMGKKKMKVMMAMKPKFFAGAEKRGYSTEAVNKLWDTIAEFAKYGFNRSHSIAYAMNAYQAAYLKAHYPVEFMASLISQNVGNKEKILAFLKEARKMRLQVGTVDINVSDIKVAPDFKNQSSYDIVYGLSGVNAVSKDMASIIVKEREENGPYTSVQDLINRCSPLGVSNKKIYENLALAGAFDRFAVSRKGVVESLPAMLGEAKTKASKGASLFDLFDDDEDLAVEMDISHIEEYPFVTKLQHEANVIGLYLTDHPLSKAGTGLSQGGVIPIKKLLQSTSTTTAVIVGSITDIEKKIRKVGGASIQITVDDGSGYFTANLTRDIVKGMGKKNAQDRVKKFYTENEADISKDIEAEALAKEFTAMAELEKNNVYIMSVTFRPPFGEGQYGARVNDIRPLLLSHDGSLPVRIRVHNKGDGKVEAMQARIDKFAKALEAKYPGNYPLFAAIVSDEDLIEPIDDAPYYQKLIADIRKTPGKPTKTSEKKAGKPKALTFGDEVASEAVSKKENSAAAVRTLPPPAWTEDEIKKITEDILSERVAYFDTGVRIAKNAKVEQLLSDKFGGERIDFGIFNTSMSED